MEDDQLLASSQSHHGFSAQRGRLNMQVLLTKHQTHDLTVLNLAAILPNLLLTLTWDTSVVKCVNKCYKLIMSLNKMISGYLNHLFFGRETLVGSAVVHVPSKIQPCLNFGSYRLVICQCAKILGLFLNKSIKYVIDQSK